MAKHILNIHDYEIDLVRLYRAMYDQSHIEDGLRVFSGNKRDTTAMKWLLAELFDLPVTVKQNEIYGDARRAVTLEMDRLGWATKVSKHNEPVLEGVESRTGRYLLHVNPEDLPPIDGARSFRDARSDDGAR